MVAGQQVHEKQQVRRGPAVRGDVPGPAGAGIARRAGGRDEAAVRGEGEVIHAGLISSTPERRTKQLGYYRPKHAETHTAIPGSVLDRVNRLEDQMKAAHDKIQELTQKETKAADDKKQAEAAEAKATAAFDQAEGKRVIAVNAKIRADGTLSRAIVRADTAFFQLQSRQQALVQGQLGGGTCGFSGSTLIPCEDAFVTVLSADGSSAWISRKRKWWST